jgi:hypothetical protein
VHLSAQENGLWLLPLGLFVIVGAQLGGRLTHYVSIGTIITAGLAIETVAMALAIWAIEPGITFWHVGPALAVFGVGLGFASSQLTSIVLSEVTGERSGVASGANSTARQMGAAFGAAIMGSLITVQMTNRAVSALRRSDLAPAVREQMIGAVRDTGPSTRPAATLSATDVATIERIFTESLATAARIALLFSMGVVFTGALLSLLIPRVRPVRRPAEREVVDTFEAFEPMDVDPAQL